MKGSTTPAISRSLVAIVFLLGALVSFWFLLTNLHPIGPVKLLVPVVLFIGIFLIIKTFRPELLHRAMAFFTDISTKRYFLIISLALVVAAGLMIRFYCYFRFSYDPSTDADPNAIYSAAQAIASGEGILGDVRTASCAYLSTYMTLLSYPMLFIQDPWLATILLNTAADLCGATIVMLLVKRIMKPSRVLQVLAFALWFLSPFGIVFSLLTLPNIVVNTCIVLVIYTCVMLIEHLLKGNTLKAFLFAPIVGIVMGIANCFRPIFPVAIIALVIALILLLFLNKQVKKLGLITIAAIIILAIPFGIIQRVQIQLVSAQTGIAAPSSSGGFSFYVGANRDSNGRFNSTDWSYRQELIDNSPDIETAYAQLQAEAIDRYRSYGVLGTLDLFVNKLYVFSSDQNIMYNADSSINGYQESRLAKILDNYILIFCAFLYTACALLLIRSAKDSLHKNASPGVQTQALFFICVLMLGFFLSDAFVEAAHRYAQIVYPLFIALATGIFVRGK